MNVTSVDEVSTINIVATATPVDARNDGSAIRMSRPIFFFQMSRHSFGFFYRQRGVVLRFFSPRSRWGAEAF